MLSNSFNFENDQNEIKYVELKKKKTKTNGHICSQKLRKTNLTYNDFFTNSN